jgi:hypothetical protein
MGLDRRLEDRPQDPPDPEAVLHILERIRARALLDLLDGARATDALAPEGPLRQRRADLLREIASVQRELRLPRLIEPARREHLARLDRLEAEDVALRDEIGRAAPGFAAARQFAPPKLADVQAQLAPHQALIEYLTGSPGQMRAGILMVTRAAAQIVPLEIAEGLRDRLSAWLGLIERRAAAEAGAAARLEAELLGPVLRALPPGIDELLISPHGELHRVPFAALRAEAASPPLAARFRVTLIPSASIWMRCARMPASANASGVLAVALPSGAPAPLGALPHAAREARAMLRAFDGEGLELVQREASESFLKGTDLDRFSLIHFAAHAVVDEVHPDRSSIVLSAGAPEEDGLLQIREIVTLPLQAKGIVLSACSGAAGPIVQGEGVMGLSRAFFQAGARTVVGSLWPLRDDEAADLMAGLAAGLSRGRSLGAALAETQRARIAEGWPAAAWAGLVVLGDGGLAPRAGGSTARAGLSWIWPIALLAGVGGLAWVTGRASRPPARIHPA